MRNTLTDPLIQNEQLSTKEKEFLRNLFNAADECGNTAPVLHQIASQRITNAVKAIFSEKTEEIATQKARFIILEEFLVREELEALMAFVLRQQSAFQPTKVLLTDKKEGMIDSNNRRSHVLFDLEQHRSVITKRILTYLPRILDKLKYAAFPTSKIEVQLTATNDGEYFKTHIDNTHELLRTREITFVYYFYREPKPFTGGELKLYDSYIEKNHSRISNSFKMIEPQHNQIIFFPSGLMHEVMPVSCPSQLFMDSRFTINGWIHK